MTTPFTPFSGSTTLKTSTNNALTDALLVPNSGITISNFELNASALDAVNFYDGSLSGLGIGKGLLLTSGTTPGTMNDIGWFGQSNGGAGDADINAVVNTVFQTQSYDATTLSFDFKTDITSTATSITFDLVMGSDEYPEWVNSFVDSAVVIVNGVNYALFNHNANNPLSVVSQNLAAGYFQDNASGFLPIQYDGVSQVLKIVAPINAGGAVNHIKIGVADTGDHIYDTGLFIANLSAGNAPGSGIVVTPSTGTVNDDTFTGSAKDEYFDLKAGNDTVYSGIGDDIVVGGAGNDVIFGGSGNDQIEGDAGNDDIDGGDGLSDTAIYTGIAADYTIAKDASGNYTVTGLDGSIDTLKNIEIVKFSNGTVNLVPLAPPVVPTSISTVTPVVTPVAVFVDPIVVAPVNNTGSVFINGVGSVGEVLTASVTDSDGVSGTVTYEWLVNGISVGTGDSYTVTSSNLPTNGNDSFIEVTANYFDDAGNAETLNSAAKKILETENTGDTLINVMKIDAPAGATIANPLTTLVKNLVALETMSTTDAGNLLKSVLGLPIVDVKLDAKSLPIVINLQHYDPYTILSSTPTDKIALKFEKAAVQIAILTSLSNDDTGMKLASAVLAAAKNGVKINLAQVTDTLDTNGVVTELGLESILNVNPNATYNPLNDIFDFNDTVAQDGKSISSIQNVWLDVQTIQDPSITQKDIADLSIHINQAPTGTATAILANINEDAPAFMLKGLLDGFSDFDGGTLSVSNLTVSANAGTINGLTFTPAANYNAPVELTYDVLDGQGGSIAASQFFVINAVNDAPTGAVTISNVFNAKQGDVLTANNSLSDADGTTKSVLTYQWQRNGSDVVGATGETYTLTQTDVNANISVIASYIDDQGTKESVASALTNAIINVNDAPTGEVKISNTFNAQQGDTLTVGNTLADIDGMLGANIIYSWRDANNNEIATGSSYQLTQADVGAKITVVASYTDDFGTTESVTSASTNAIINVNDVPTGSVSITSSDATNQTLTANTSTVADADGLSSFNYQWLTTGNTVLGTSATYSPTLADAGKVVSLKVSYLDGGNFTETLVSTNSITLANTPTPVTTGKTIIGTKGNDKLVGTDGNDSIFGGKGDDKLLGGAGNDLLKGEKGDDLLTGGTGADFFVFVNNAGEDKILDFKPLQGDKIQLSADTGITALNLLSHINVEDNGIEIEFVEGKVLLVGVTTLDVSDVIFS